MAVNSEAVAWEAGFRAVKQYVRETNRLPTCGFLGSWLVSLLLGPITVRQCRRLRRLLWWAGRHNPGSRPCAKRAKLQTGAGATERWRAHFAALEDYCRANPGAPVSGKTVHGGLLVGDWLHRQKEFGVATAEQLGALRALPCWGENSASWAASCRAAKLWLSRNQIWRLPATERYSAGGVELRAWLSAQVRDWDRLGAAERELLEKIPQWGSVRASAA